MAERETDRDRETERGGEREGGRGREGREGGREVGRKREMETMKYVDIETKR